MTNTYNVNNRDYKTHNAEETINDETSNDNDAISSKILLYTNAFINLDKSAENLNILNRILQYANNKFNKTLKNFSIITPNSLYRRIFDQPSYQPFTYTPISKFNQTYSKKSETLRMEELFIFIHCRPENVKVLNRMVIMFSNVKEYNDLIGIGEYTIDYLFIKDSLPKENAFINSILIKYNPKSKYRFINSRLLDSYNENNTNVNPINNKKIDQIVTFSFKIRPRNIKIGGVWLSLITFEELLEFKEFLMKFVYQSEFPLWSINEPPEIINSLFQTLLDEDFLVSNYFPNLKEHYWFAIPLCRDYRSKNLIAFLSGNINDNDDDNDTNIDKTANTTNTTNVNHTNHTTAPNINLQQLTTKATKLLSSNMYTSFLQNSINPIHNGLLTSLVLCTNYTSGYHFYTNQKHKITFEKLNIDHSKCF